MSTRLTLAREVGRSMVVLGLAGSSVGGVASVVAVATRIVGR